MNRSFSGKSVSNELLSGVFAATTICQLLTYAQELPSNSQIISCQVTMELRVMQ